MFQHLRANLCLLLFTVALCAVLYPVCLWAVGQSLFRHQAQGSLIDASGNSVTADEGAVGSRLIAQPFSGDGYFQPRPSAASYNASASGASNWGPGNPLLRDRVARQLSSIVKYKGGPKKGQPVGPDVEAWFQSKPTIVAEWAKANPSVATAWVKADKLNTDLVADWLKATNAPPEKKPEDVAVEFFTDYSRLHPGAFPGVVERKSPDGKVEKLLEPLKAGPDVQSYFFDLWLQEQAKSELELVPADLVMASGSGLDLHITLKGALYQIDGVAGWWANQTKRDVGEVRQEIEDLLRRKHEAPLGGLGGVDLVNVLEVNLALRQKFAQ